MKYITAQGADILDKSGPQKGMASQAAGKPRVETGLAPSQIAEQSWLERVLGRARLQPCRPSTIKTRAIAPEGRRRLLLM